MAWWDDVWNAVKGSANVVTGGLTGALDQGVTAVANALVPPGTDVGKGVSDFINSPGVASGLDLAGGYWTGASAKEMQEKANEWNMAEAERNRQFQQSGQQRQMDFDSQQAGISRQFNSAEAEKNRMFQMQQVQEARAYETMMSSSAYQRATADMRAAGINPMLAYMQGGASTPNVGVPSGATATSTPAHGSGVSGSQGVARPATAGAEIMARKIGESISNSFQLRRMNKDIENMESMIGKNNSEKLVNQELAETQRTIQAYNRATTAKALKETARVGLENQKLGMEMPMVKERSRDLEATHSINYNPVLKWNKVITDTLGRWIDLIPMPFVSKVSGHKNYE